ncbi:MAG: NAD(P)H-hydrate dehydratase [Omnitrophica bacterium RBG_13_46_9]|nr:MAG: NAD(P)H-hydrate dehydratase [Omnitrophica bacterium RBG_13_46_9]
MVKKHISKIPLRKQDTHKGDFGHVFVLAGSTGMTGAAYLSAQAALLSGSGLVTCGIPESLNSIMEVKLTEVMTLPLPETKEATLALDGEKEIVDFSVKVDVVAMGPGLSKNRVTQKLVRSLLDKIDKPIVLDADGLNAIADDCRLVNRDAPTILTPHAGEMSRLTKKDINEIQQNREDIARDFAKRHKVIVVLKGYRTVVVNAKGAVYVNKTGNSGMSTAGVGDVLTGMISSFVGQGIDPYSAAVIGVYLHGLAGDIAAKEKGPFSLIARDILDKLPKAIQSVV